MNYYENNWNNNVKDYRLLNKKYNELIEEYNHLLEVNESLKQEKYNISNKFKEDNNTLKNQIQNLKNKIQEENTLEKSNKEKIEELNKKLENYKKTVNDINIDCKNQKTKNKSLEEKSRKQEVELNKLLSQLEEEKKNIEKIKNKNLKINEDYKILENKFKYEESNKEKLQKEKFEINNLYNNLKDEHNNLLNNNKNIQKKLIEKEENNKQLNDLLNDLKKNIENGEIVEKYIKLKNQNEKLINDNKLMDKKTKDTDIIELNKQLNVDLEKERNRCFQLEQEIEKIKKQKIIEYENYKKNDYNEEYIDKQLESFYDVVINIKSINSLTKPEGWPIKWNLERKDIYEKIKSENLLKVGVLGNGNVGKSFLLSRLFNINIPSGYSVITEGLSLKYNENESYTILDSAGLQTPLIKDEEILKDDKENESEVNISEQKRKKYENLYKDKTQTENFIQNLIIYESDMLLIVVGKLTFNEQRLINKIKKEIESGPNENNKKTKPIYIIHNLMNFQKRKQVEDHINNTLLKSASFNISQMKYVDKQNNIDNNNVVNANIEKYREKRIIFVENDKENEIQVYHLIMAREGTEAGDYYNNYTYQVLNEHFNLFTRREPLSIIEEVKNRFIEWSNDLLEENINDNNIEIVKDENNKEIKYIFKESEDKKENNKLIPKACISDELGLSIYRSNGYEPPYYFYVENDENSDKLVVVLEIPGDKKIDEIYANTETKEIIVKGSKSIMDFIKPLYNNSAKFGKFNLHIPYGNRVQIAAEDPIGEGTFKDGIYSCKFELIKKRKVNRK